MIVYIINVQTFSQLTQKQGDSWNLMNIIRDLFFLGMINHEKLFGCVAQVLRWLLIHTK